MTEHQSIEVSVDETDIVDQIADEGRFQIYGIKDNGFEAYVAFYNTEIPGVYTTDDMFYDACGIIVSANDYTGIRPVAPEATIVATDNGYKCTATFDGDNGVEYDLTFNYEFPKHAPTTMTLDGEVEDHTADNGYFLISATDKEYKRTFSFRVNAPAFAAGQYGTDAIDSEHTYFALYSKDAELKDVLDFVSGSANLSLQSTGFTWEGTFLMKSAMTGESIEYTLTVSGPKPLKDGNSYDYKEEGFAASYPWASAEIDAAHAADGIISLDTWTPTPEGYELQVHLEFNVAEQDDKHALPLGSYPINSTGLPGTVTAASMTNDMLGFFVAYTVYGWIVSPLWFIDEGTVLVNEGLDGLSITVEAINTWGLPISIQIGEKNPVGIFSPVATTATRAAKVITHDGLRITKDGKSYMLNGVHAN